MRELTINDELELVVVSGAAGADIAMDWSIGWAGAIVGLGIGSIVGGPVGGIAGAGVGWAVSAAASAAVDISGGSFWRNDPSGVDYCGCNRMYGMG